MIEIINPEEEPEMEFNPQFEDNEEEQENAPLAPIVEMQTKAEEPKEESHEEDKGPNLSEQWKDLADYLQDNLNMKAEQDELFAKTLSKENKSMNECLKYIIGEIQNEAIRNGGCGCFHNDARLVELAIHYYDEDDIKIRGMFAKVAMTSTRPASTSIPSTKPAFTPPTPIHKPEPAEPKKGSKEWKKRELAKVELSLFDF